MIDLLLFIPIFCSFCVALLLLPFWIQKAQDIGLVWRDMNKFSPRASAAGSGGIIVVLAFVLGALLFIAYRVFFFHESATILVNAFSLLTVILILSSIGLIDDLLGWQKGGLSRRSRIVLVALASIPLIAIHAGQSGVELPFFGAINLGLFFPLVIIPLGLVGATTTYNFLAGFNGLEAGQGILLLGAFGLVSYLTGSSWLSIIALCMISSLIAFLIFNWSPARVFPGDSLTYAVGGLLAMMAIFGNFEKIAVFFFIPYILETILKSRGKLVKHSFGKPTADGALDMPYTRIYGLEHAAIWFLNKTGLRATETRVVIALWTFQLIIIIAGFVIFRQGIFG